MNEFGKPSLFVEQKRLEAILKNKNYTTFWEEKKNAHEEVKKNLNYFAEKLQEHVMVPIGKRGLVKGRIINTNQVFVSLGGGWFAKTCSAEAQKICARRISECNTMLEKLQKERKLFEGWTALPRQQIFATDETKEIIEPYDEKEEEFWRKQHAEKVKEHKKKLAQVKKELDESRGKEKSKEDLWRHLELLEMQEEFEDELDRIDENSNSESESATSSLLDSDDDSTEEEDNCTSPEQNRIAEKKTNVSEGSILSKKQQSKILNPSEEQESDESGDSSLHVECKTIEKQPKVGITSILTKNQQRNGNKEKTNTSISTKKISFADSKEQNSTELGTSISKVETIAIGQVKENLIDEVKKGSQEINSRPTSKFKSSRQKR